MCLIATPRGEVAQMLASATSKWGLNGEEWAALLRIRTRPECPEGNLRDLALQQPRLWDSYPGIPPKALTTARHTHKTKE